LNKWLVAIAFSVLLLVPLGAQNAFAHGTVDQSFTGPFAGFGSVTTFEAFGQEFTPTVSSLVAVDVFLQPNAAAGTGTTDTQTVTIRSDSKSGTILGSASKVVTGVAGDPISPQHFDFDPPVSLTPGSIHVVTVKVQSSTAFNWLILEGNPYPGGSAIGFPSPPFDDPDLGFATYFILPVGGNFVPLDTTALLLAGAQSFSWMIPVTLSVLGIGLFVVSRKSE